MWSKTIGVRLVISSVIAIAVALVPSVTARAETGAVSRYTRPGGTAVRTSVGEPVRLLSMTVRSDDGEHAERRVAFHRGYGGRRYGHRRYGAYRYGYRGYHHSPHYGYGYYGFGYGYSPYSYGYRYSPYGYSFSYGYATPYRYRTYPYTWGYYARPWSSYYYRPWYYRPYSYGSYGVPWSSYPESYGYRGSVYVPVPALSGQGGPVRYYGTYGYGCAPDCDE